MEVYLATLGCRLNEAELESWTRGFRAAGHRVVGRPGDAQVMVLNTCAVTGEAARKSRKLVGGMHRQNPSANLVLTGCFAELEPERASSLAGVDLVVSNRDKENLVALVGERFSVPTMPEMATEPDGAHVFAAGAGHPAGHPATGTRPSTGLVQLGARAEPARARTRAFIKVQDGCRNRCAFCIVTIARGDERSRAIAEIVVEVDDLHRRGYREVVLTGVHLGGYGSDIGTDLSALVEAVLTRTSIPRVRLSSLEPWDLPADFFSLWRHERLMPHLHLPLQSGSDSVLRRMSRRCSTAEFADLAARARAAIPGLSLTTDIIVGFPGETEAEWVETVDFVRAIDFAHMHIFTYSPRDGTKAARLPGQLGKAVKRGRSQILHRLAAAMKAEHLRRFVDTERPVLWEGEGVVEMGGGRRFVGYTDNYLRVETVSEEPLGNRVTRAHLYQVDARADRLCARVVIGIGSANAARATLRAQERT